MTIEGIKAKMLKDKVVNETALKIRELLEKAKEALQETNYDDESIEQEILDLVTGEDDEPRQAGRAKDGPPAVRQAGLSPVCFFVYPNRSPTK